MAKSKSKTGKKPSTSAKPVKPAVKAKGKSVKQAAKPKGKAVKPVVKAKAKPVAKKVAKPVKKVAAKKAKPVKKAKPAAKKVVKPVVKKTAKPVAKKKVVAKKPVKAVKPVIKKVVKSDKPALKSVLAKAPKYVVTPQPKPVKITETKTPNKTMSKKGPNEKELNMRYSDEELKEFKDLVDKKLVSARDELKYLKEALDNHNDTQAGNKAWNMEEGTDTSEMETLMNQISRQHQYIRNLELALVRIENKTYGICRVTGKLIPKERLRIVPHATLSLEAKLNRKSDDVSPGAAAAAPPADFAEGFED